jgi:DNA-binding transcriptional LysR family regulator
MELKYIEIFCAVVELKSFSKAARALHLTQPTVSIHIKALEEEFSTRLLDRFGRTVRPTQDGEILYRYAKEIMALKTNARLAMERLSESMSGRLIIGASTIPGEYILPHYLSRFKSAYPDVFPMLKIGDSKEIHESVLQGRVDLGVIGTKSRDKNIVTRKFLDDELILIAPTSFRDSVLSRGALKLIPLLMRETGSGSRASVEEHLRKVGIDLDSLNIAAEIGSSQSLIQAVKAGMGLAFTSRLSVTNEIQQKNLKTIKLKGIRMVRNFQIISHRLRHHTRLCSAFMEFLMQKSN